MKSIYIYKYSGSIFGSIKYWMGSKRYIVISTI